MTIREIFQDRVLTVSNIITSIRIVAAPFLGYFIYREATTGDHGYIVWQMALVAVIVLSDFLDGFLARLNRQVTKLGQFLDPVADKFSAIIALVFLVLYKGYPFWAFVVIVARELLAVIAGTTLLYLKGIEVKPNIFGKMCVVAMAFSGCVYILSLDYSLFGVTLKEASVFLVMLLYLIGGIQYIRTYLRRAIGTSA